MADEPNDEVMSMLREMREEMATKDDLAGLATKDDLAGLKDDVVALTNEVAAFRSAVNVRFDALGADVSKIAEMLVERHVDKLGDDELAEADIGDLRARIEAIERHLGIARQ